MIPRPLRCRFNARIEDYPCLGFHTPAERAACDATRQRLLSQKADRYRHQPNTPISPLAYSSAADYNLAQNKITREMNEMMEDAVGLGDFFIPPGLPPMPTPSNIADDKFYIFENPNFAICFLCSKGYRAEGPYTLSLKECLRCGYKSRE